MNRDLLMEIYHRLYSAFGPQHWWPGDGPVEVMVGAVLTQNTNWANVEKAINNLKQAGCLDLASLNRISVDELAVLIRPSGYYNVKARRLKALVEFICREFSCRVEDMEKVETYKLRERLLGISGLGPETVDSILLYALGRPIFVVDAYTKRIFSRHGLCFEDVDYQELQCQIMASLDPDVGLFNEYHALLVRLGKEYCRKTNPNCLGCPLNGL